jgi:hypothetical protein
MILKTGLPHEQLGGRTRVAFEQPQVHPHTQKDQQRIIYVPIHFIKSILKKDGTSFTRKFFQPELMENQMKKIKCYARKLALEHAQKLDLKIKKDNLGLINNSTWTGFMFIVKKA